MVWFFSFQSSGKWRVTIKASELKELMLNAVALNAILDVDECLGRLDWSQIDRFRHQRDRGTTDRTS